ncbi:MAG TPA: RnfABCDGE type electron transport complex subunit D, partial [Tepidisphaeraceae bacterium]
MDAVPAEPSAAQEIAAVRVPRGLTPRLHSGISVSRFFGLHAMGALFPIAAGAMLYGWRAIVSMAVVVISAAAGIAVWKRIGIRGYQLRYAHGLWLALLLALMLPAHLATKLPLSDQTGRVLWPILPAAGICIATLLWLLGGLGSARIHPVLVAYLVVSVFFQKDLVPHWILQRQHVFAGDVLDVSPAESAGPRRDAWIKAKPPSEPVLDSNHPRAALRSEPASQQLIFFTSGTEPPARAWLSLEGLMRDVMPPLEDCIIGGQPGPIGTSSVIAVIIGGLFLLYR